MRTHRLDAAPGTVHWDFFDASLRPLITVEPGDEVIMSTVSGAPQAMPHSGSGLTVPAALSAIHAKLICARTGLCREDAYTLCSLAADLRVTQVVNGSEGIHVMLGKAPLSCWTSNLL